MNWIDPYTFLLTTLGFIVLYLSLVLLRPPRKLSRTMLAAAAALSGIFILLTVFELVLQNREVMIVLRNLQQISLVFTPYFLLGYALELHRESPKKTLRFIGLLAVPSMVDIGLIFTDAFHGLMREEIIIRTIWNYTEVSTVSTLLNSFLGNYPFGIYLITIFLLIRNMFDVPKQYRMTHWLSALLIFLSIFVIILTSLLAIEVPGIFALSTCSMAFLLILANKRTDINKVWPVSRQEVLENLSEGIMLIDQQGKVVEVNEVSCHIMEHLFDVEEGHEDVVEHSAYDLFVEVPSLLQALDSNEDTIFLYERKGRYFDIHVKCLSRKANELRLVVWKDITDKKTFELQLKQLADFDSLTCVLNRRAFMKAFEQRSDEETQCFLLMDIDHFKKVNDQYGHFVGDVVLQHVAERLRSHFPGGIITRLGGEEFGVLMSIDLIQATAQAEAFQTALKEESIRIHPAIDREITVSIGICSVPSGAPFGEVYQQVDRMMYKAKDEGRDTICVSS